MTHSVKNEINYAAMVIEVPELRKAQNSDRLHILTAQGINVVVSDEWVGREGTKAILFPSESQLSEMYCRTNNLYRDNVKNINPEESGYIEDNRRVRAIKLRGNISNGMAMPIESLEGFGNYSDLKVGDVFDTLNGHELVRKYLPPSVREASKKNGQAKAKKESRVPAEMLPEHVDTQHYLRNEDKIGPWTEMVITQKLHGTSVRLAHTYVNRKLKWYEKFAQKVGIPVQDKELALVAGSRKVVKDPNNPNQNHFYKQDVWTHALERFSNKIPAGTIIYGEIVGFVPGTEEPIQKGHTYEAERGDYDLYVYRVTSINEFGVQRDFTWDQVRGFCEVYGFNHVPELYRTHKDLFQPKELEEKNFYEDFQKSYIESRGLKIYVDQPVRLSPGGTGKDEGIVIRTENGLNEPEFFKMKNASHFEFETKQADSGEADMETEN